MSPRDLVCARCWRDFFNTESFEKCCTCDHLRDGHKHRSIETVAANSEIKDADCTWCAYIRSFSCDSWMPEDRGRQRLLSEHLVPLCHGEVDRRGCAFSPRLDGIRRSASGYVTARPLQTDVDSEAARMQLRAWSEECKGHEYCSASRRDSILPTRVIEVCPPGRQHPRLVESGNSRGVYATLSYCWGKSPFPTLTRSNYAKFMEELDPLTLPPTIRHAISTTRNLSIPYLWIDALCTIQDSEEDKIREIAFMRHNYASSALTIVAASAKSVFEGFLHPRVHSEPFHTIPVRIRPGVFGTMSVNELDAACYDEWLEPLAKRAWTMQEQLLAQRTLTFTTHTMMWRCHAGTRNFGDSLYFPHDLDAGYNDDNDKYSLNLHSLLLSEEEARVRRDKALSFDRDKLNALAGIASHPSFSRALGPGYFAGLWQYGLARQLTWHTSRWHRTQPENEPFIFYRPVRYRAPSWSWASLEGGVIHFNFSFDDEYEAAPDVICDIIDCSTTLRSPELNPTWFNPSTSNIFLFPVSASVGSRTTLPYNEEVITIAEASTRHIEDFIAKYPDVDLGDEPEAAYGTDSRNMCGTYDETGDHNVVVVLCAAITQGKEGDDGVEGLLLLPSEVNGQNNIYRRIGLFERGRNECFQNETKTEISII
ncbi:HET-domain-containing protein [Rhizodiscina lignyota]|uniref:HET-domain-containing protein n=1 Tax=Rhizodiscina lignyota TaxID=1504668 RepID=A0A9P4M3A9_9PEZI|nr:HET-domain-containing protein [Rhizodiscina lignyota]